MRFLLSHILAVATYFNNQVVEYLLHTLENYIVV